MAFVAEDGTGVTDANSFITAVFFKAYHKDRGTTITSGTGAIESAAVRATDFMVSRFRFVGVQASLTQGLHWPANKAYYPDGRVASGNPIEIQESCADYTLIELNTPGALTVAPTYDDSNATVVKRRDKVGPIEEEREFGSSGSPKTWRKFPQPDNRLYRSGLVISGGRVLRS